MTEQEEAEPMRSRRMWIRRQFLGVLLGILVLNPAWVAGADTVGMEAGSRDFIESLADQTVRSLTAPDISRSERVDRFRTLFNEHFAVRSIGRWVLGKYWRKADKTERAEYHTLFEDLMAVSYVDRFASYAGENLGVVKTIAKDEKRATVFSKINRGTTGEPISVNWRVGGRNGLYKVTDIVVEGTSMSMTLRNEFASIIKQRGGTIAGLLEALREKTATLKAETAEAAKSKSVAAN